jgi:hypothetical protein
MKKKNLEETIRENHNRFEVPIAVYEVHVTKKFKKRGKAKERKASALTQDRTTDLQFTRLTLYH